MIVSNGISRSRSSARRTARSRFTVRPPFGGRATGSADRVVISRLNIAGPDIAGLEIIVVHGGPVCSDIVAGRTHDVRLERVEMLVVAVVAVVAERDQVVVVHVVEPAELHLDAAATQVAVRPGGLVAVHGKRRGVLVGRDYPTGDQVPVEPYGDQPPDVAPPVPRLGQWTVGARRRHLELIFAGNELAVGCLGGVQPVGYVARQFRHRVQPDAAVAVDGHPDHVAAAHPYHRKVFQVVARGPGDRADNLAQPRLVGGKIAARRPAGHRPGSVAGRARAVTGRAAGPTGGTATCRHAIHLPRRNSYIRPFRRANGAHGGGHRSVTRRVAARQIGARQPRNIDTPAPRSEWCSHLGFRRLASMVLDCPVPAQRSPFGAANLRQPVPDERRLSRRRAIAGMAGLTALGAAGLAVAGCTSQPATESATELIASDSLGPLYTQTRLLISRYDEAMAAAPTLVGLLGPLREENSQHLIALASMIGIPSPSVAAGPNPSGIPLPVPAGGKPGTPPAATQSPPNPAESSPAAGSSTSPQGPSSVAPSGSTSGGTSASPSTSADTAAATRVALSAAEKSAQANAVAACVTAPSGRVAVLASIAAS